jgi:hypothetical protein
MKKIPTLIAKTVTIVVALGVMFSLVLDAHQEQKQLAEKNSTVDKNQTLKPTKVFFQSSKIVLKSTVFASTIGMKIDAIKDVNKSKDVNESK